MICRVSFSVALASIALLASSLTAFAAGTFYVDNSSGSCSDSGPGTEAQPYCTISAAIAANKGPGTTILVKPGTYREMVTLNASGAAGNPFVIKALGSPVIIDGSDDFSAASKWTAYSGNIYLANSVNWGPMQVFVDGLRLAASTASPAFLPTNSFVWISGQGLYVNIGGTSPGTHVCLVGHRASSFYLSGRTYVTLDGFVTTRTDDRAIRLGSSSDNCIIRNNTASWNYKYGIYISGCSGVLIEKNLVSDNSNHGINLTNSSSLPTTNCTVQDNESCRNLNPAIRMATGILVIGSPSNLIQRNRLHDNQDSGLQIDSGSDFVVSSQNRSWNNGDHGFDQLYCNGVSHVGDVAYNNFKDGFSIEGTAPNGSVYNCIAINNGLTTTEFDLWVNDSSSVGFHSDYNIFWNSTTRQPIKFINTQYATIAAFVSATGQDAHSAQVDPKFLNPSLGDFHLQPGSAAIDAANSGVANWSATDAEGSARRDDPTMPNTGAGPVTYADRGALEFLNNIPPIGSLVATPNAGEAPLAVTLDASSSHDPDGTIAAYTFDFGDGSPVQGPQAQATATHTYVKGNWVAIVTVTDNNGSTAQGAANLSVTGSNLGPVATIVSPAGDLQIAAGQAVQFTATAIDPDNNYPLTYQWNLGGGAPNQTVLNPGQVIFNSPGSYTVSFTATDALGEPDRTPDVRLITVTPAPVGQAPDEVHYTMTSQTSVTFDWRGFDNTIRYGPTSAYGSTVTGVTPNPIPFSSPGPFWEARIPGLLENTTYHYSIGSGGDHTFHTPMPLGASGFKVYAEGDVGDSAHWSRMATMQNHIAADPPAFTLVLGDLAYGNINAFKAVDAHFNDVMKWSQDARLHAGLGQSRVGRRRVRRQPSELQGPVRSSQSADFAGVAGGQLLRRGLVLVRLRQREIHQLSGAVDLGDPPGLEYPGDHADGSGAGESFDQVHRHLRPSPGLFAPAIHPGETSLQTLLDALGSTHSKYVLNLNGHSHDYERSYPQHGVTHITAGIGGADLEETPVGNCLWLGGCPAPAWSAYRAYHHVDVRLTFGASNILIEAICGPAGDNGNNVNDITCTPGTVVDSYLIGDLPPVVTAPTTISTAENNAVSLDVTASDPDGQAINSLVATGLPSGATFVPGPGNTSGHLAWTPTYAQAGSYPITFTASNAISGSATTTINVANVDRAPVVSAPTSMTLAENSPLSISVTAADSDGDAISSLSATGLPPGATFTPGNGNTSGTVTWTPSYSQAGSYNITFSASNALTGTASTAITVSNVDRAPVVMVQPTAGVVVGSLLTIPVHAVDPDGEPITSLVVSTLPSGATFTANPGDTTGTLTWTPAFGHLGLHSLTFTASNALSGSATTVVDVVLFDRPPVVTAPGTISESTLLPFSVNVTASDPDGNPITSLSATGMPSGATFTTNADNTGGLFTWTPAAGDVGNYSVRFTATNALSGSATTQLSIYPKGAPSVAAPTVATVTENSPLSVNVTASDPDDDVITSLTASGVPAGAVFTPGSGNTTGTLTWTPNYSQAGTYSVTFTAANALSSSATTVITVNNLDRAPTVSAPPAITGKAGALMQVNVTAADPDAEAITTLSAAGPVGSSFVASNGNTTGSWTWVPPTSALGTTSVTFTAANALQGSAMTSVTVTAANQLPTVVLLATPSSGAQPLPVTLDASQSTDADGTIVSYRFDCGDGTIIGPQSSAVVPHLYAAGNWTASVTVTDNDGGTRTASVPITVAGPPNLVANPSFEDGLAGWAALGTANLTRVAGGNDGVFSAQLNSTATTTATFGINDHPDWVGNVMTAGTRYRFSAWVRSASSVGNVKIQVTEYLVSTGANLGSLTSTAVKLSPTWQLVTGDYITHGGPSSTTLDFWVKDWPLALNEVFQVDNISIRDVTLNPGAPPVNNGPADGPSVSTDDPLKKMGGHDTLPVVQPSAAIEQTSIGFGTTQPGLLRVDVQNSAGVSVRALSNDPNAAAGNHSIAFDDRGSDGQRLPGGAYTFHLTTADGVRTIKFVIPSSLGTADAPAASASATAQPLAATADTMANARPQAVVAPLAPLIVPSPVHDHSTLSFATSVAGRLSVEILDLAGRRVRTLADDSNVPAGLHHFDIDGRGNDGQRLGAGVYFYRIVAVEGTRANRFVIVR